MESHDEHADLHDGYLEYRFIPWRECTELFVSTRKRQQAQRLSTVSRRGLLQATHEAAAFAGCIHSHTGLTLREHPIAFLRKDLAARSLVTCGEAMSARDGRWLMTGGLVRVRQMPGSAKGVMFLTIEDEPDGLLLIISADTHFFPPAHFEALTRGIEDVAVEAALDPTAPTKVTTTD